MRWIVGALGIIGALGGFFQGYVWTNVLVFSEEGVAVTGLAGREPNEKLDEAAVQRAEKYLSKLRAIDPLMICAAAGFALSFLTMFRKGHRLLNGGLLVLAGVVPMFFEFEALFGAPMALAGFLTLGVDIWHEPVKTA